MDGLSTANLGDVQLSRRCVKLADRFADNLTLSIPGACNDWAETKGAYRFLSQKNNSWEKILAPHMASTGLRIQQHPVAVYLQESTKLDYSGQVIYGLGTVSCEAQRGMYLHRTYAITIDR
jgi:hypothetical protein